MTETSQESKKIAIQFLEWPLTGNRKVLVGYNLDDPQDSSYWVRFIDPEGRQTSVRLSAAAMAVLNNAPSHIAAHRDTKTEPIQSPLSEAEPASLDELFQRLDSHIAARTLNLPGAQKSLDLVIAELRRQRAAWQAAEASGATKAPRAKKVAGTQTTLDDLGL